MRVIAKKILLEFINKNNEAEQAILSWHNEMISNNFNTPNELKEKYKSASLIGDKRVIFNINGNKYRLIVEIEYKLKIVFIIWLGSHKEYDKIDVKEIKYANTN
jgi:mRNA interferase HigB